jgi:hypothetical protein
VVEEYAGAPPPPQPVATTKPIVKKKEEPPVRLLHPGGEVFGDWFPLSNAASRLIPGPGGRLQPAGEMSIFTGVRALVGFRLQPKLQLTAGLMVGYVATGASAGNGSDVVALGFSAEVDWILHEYAWLIGRAVVALPVSTLHAWSFYPVTATAYAIVGVRLLHFAALGVCIGRDFGGALAFGPTVGLGFQ